MYEFIVLLLENDTLQGIQLEEKHGNELVENLQCKFPSIYQSNDDDNEDDQLSLTIEEMFNNDKEKAVDTATNMRLVVEDDEDIEDELDPNISAHESRITQLHKYALVDVFEHGNQHLIQQNILSTRQRRKKRLCRVSNYFIYVYSKVNILLNRTLISIHNLSSSTECNLNVEVPNYRVRYNIEKSNI